MLGGGAENVTVSVCVGFLLLTLCPRLLWISLHRSTLDDVPVSVPWVM